MSSGIEASPATPAAVGDAQAAGAMLRQAREAQGRSLEDLAHVLKVPVRKLQALEEGRVADLQGGLTFVRALALSACRVLHVDSAPVIAQLPLIGDTGLEQVSRGINQTFHDRIDAPGWHGLVQEQRGVLLLIGGLVLAALVLWLLPAVGCRRGVHRQRR